MTVEVENIDQKDSIRHGRDERLTRQDQFTAVRVNGRSFAGRYCVINILKTSPDGFCRAAFSISRRYSKLAVDRNRARRLFREVFRRVKGGLDGCWIIFVPRQKMKKAGMQDVLDDASIAIGKILEEYSGNTY